MRRLACVAAVAGIAGLALAAGCEPKPAGPVTLEAASVHPLADVPVPEGFYRVNEKSVAYVEGGKRMAHLVYRGKAPIDSVSDFYGRQMPATYGWQRGPAELAGNSMVRKFTKGPAWAVIKMIQDGPNAEITIMMSDPGGAGS